MYAGLGLNDRFPFMEVVDKEGGEREGEGESPHRRLWQRIVKFPFLDLLIKDTPKCPSPNFDHKGSKIRFPSPCIIHWLVTRAPV